MKYLRIILINSVMILLFSCNTGQKNFDWLLGDWQRINEKAGQETYESWGKISSTEYEGLGFTMQDGDTIWQERIKLIQRDGVWDLMVISPDEAKYTSFRMTSQKAFEFTCVNEEHDFPNEIKYWKDGNLLRALVSGSDMKISFDFEAL